MRRIITGHNENGKSVISIDGPPARSIGEEAGGLYEIWNTDGSGFDTTSNEDRADIDIVLSPVQKGTKFRYFQITHPRDVPIMKMKGIIFIIKLTNYPKIFNFNFRNFFS